jgi:hypothetical protein
MKDDSHPWRDCWQIKLLQSLYLPIVGIVGFIPTILIMHSFKEHIFILLAVIYFFLILLTYLAFTRYVDNKLKEKCLKDNKK